MAAIADQPLTAAECHLVLWHNGLSMGSFMRKLFDTMSLADSKNLDKLSLGFPAEVAVFRLFAYEGGYMEMLEHRTRAAGLL